MCVRASMQEGVFVCVRVCVCVCVCEEKVSEEQKDSKKEIN